MTSMDFVFVIEHLEDDEDTQKAIPPWVELEYTHRMRTLLGPDSRLRFTNLSKTSAESLNAILHNSDNDDSLLSRASCHTIGVMDLVKGSGEVASLDEICLLDPKAQVPLTPQDGDGRFKWFLFGGILGDDPPRDRPAEFRVLGCPCRHLGPIQMTTDTAVGVTKRVVCDKEKIAHIDFPTITFNGRESVDMLSGTSPLKQGSLFSLKAMARGSEQMVRFLIFVAIEAVVRGMHV